jgi:hypothetical protein
LSTNPKGLYLYFSNIVVVNFVCFFVKKGLEEGRKECEGIKSIFGSSSCEKVTFVNQCDRLVPGRFLNVFLANFIFCQKGGEWEGERGVKGKKCL